MGHSCISIDTVTYGISKALIFAPGTSMKAWATASFVTGLPGILVQLVFIPAIVAALMRAGLIPRRYEQERGISYAKKRCH